MVEKKQLPATLEDLLTVLPADSASFFSPIYDTVRMGNRAEIGFGGFTIGVALSAACQATPGQYNLHSMQAIYLGPLLCQGKIQITVSTVRQTGAFSTCIVSLRQERSKDVWRNALIALCDFQTAAPNVLLYSVNPKNRWSHYSELDDFPVHLRKKFEEGQLHREWRDAYLSRFAPAVKYLEIRHCPDGVLAQTINGLNAKSQTSQDDLPVTSKVTAFWVKTRHEIKTSITAVHQKILAWILDMTLSFLPAVFSGKAVEEFTALSSLDSSLRFHTINFRADRFILVELFTERAGHGRTFSRNRAWDDCGTLIASNDQACIVRARGNERSVL